MPSSITVITIVLVATNMIVTDSATSSPSMSHHRHHGSHNSHYHDHGQYNSSSGQNHSIHQHNYHQRTDARGGSILSSASSLTSSSPSLSSSSLNITGDMMTEKSQKLTLINSYKGNDKWNNGQWWRSHIGNIPATKTTTTSPATTTTTTTITTSTNRPLLFVNRTKQQQHQQQSSIQKSLSSSSFGMNVGRSHKDHLYTTKSHAGRHVCGEHTIISSGQSTKDIRLKNSPEDPFDAWFNSLQPARPIKQLKLTCCPGWMQISKNSNGCTKPICKYPCKNGGRCIKPETCSCPAGYTGPYCELDRNECKESKPCDQFCYNTDGSYYCACRDGFQLQSDRQSCRKIGGGDAAIEARDMENDVSSYDDLYLRIDQMQRNIWQEKEVSNQMHKAVESNAIGINRLKLRMDNLEHRQQDLTYIKDRLSAQEAQSRKLEYIVDLLYKCRAKPAIFCPL